MFNRIRRTTTAGPALQFRCARCERDVVGPSVDQHERFLAFGVVPTFGKTNVYVTCPDCRTSYESRLPMDALVHITDQDVTPFLYDSGPAYKTVLMFVALFVAIMPIVGLLAGVGMVWLTRRRAGHWQKIGAWAALALAVGTTGWMVYVIASVR